MLPRGGRAADKTMRGVGAEGAVQGKFISVNPRNCSVLYL